MCLCGYLLAMERVCYHVLPFIMEYKHGVVETQTQFGAGSESFSGSIDRTRT